MADKDKGPVKSTDKKSKTGWLKKSFNVAASIGAGALTAFAVKTIALSALSATGSPVIASALIASAVTGLAMGSLSLYKERKKQKESGVALPSLFSKNTFNKLALHSSLSVAGGSVFLFWGDEIADGLKGIYNFITGGTDSTPVQPAPILNTPADPLPVNETGSEKITIIIDETSNKDPQNSILEPPPEINTQAPPLIQPPEILDERVDVSTDIDEPVVITEEPELPKPAELPEIPDVVQLSPAEQLLENLTSTADTQLQEALDALDNYIQQHSITDERFLALVESAHKGNSQALKDIASIINNHGKIICIDLVKDKTVVMELYEAAIAKDNTQAIIDYAYMQHYGHNGLATDKGAAIELMGRVLETTDPSSKLYEVANCFYEQWTEGYDGRNCTEGPDCLVDNAVIQEEVTPEPREPELNQTNIEHPAAETNTQSKMNCDAVINNKEITFICDLDGRAPQFQTGDKVIIDKRNMDFILSPN
jgi:hypothetical protein